MHLRKHDTRGCLHNDRLGHKSKQDALKWSTRGYRGDALICYMCVHEAWEFVIRCLLRMRSIHIYIYELRVGWGGTWWRIHSNGEKCILLSENFQHITHADVLSGWNFVYSERYLIHTKTEHPLSEIICHSPKIITQYTVIFYIIFKSQGITPVTLVEHVDWGQLFCDTFYV